MRMLLTFLLVGVLSGCATQSPNPWVELETDVSPATQPLNCVMPLPDEVVGQSIVYTTAHALEAYRVCSEANEAIAQEHALQIGQLKLARKGLVEAGQSQRAIADMRKEMLEDERRHNFFEKIGYWIVIIGMGTAL